MLEGRRANHRWPSTSGKSNDGSGTREVTLAGSSETNDLKPNARDRMRQTSVTNRVSCRGTFAGYDVTGWRYIEDASWHVKVWPAGRPAGWIGYTVTAGKFELTMVAQAHRDAVLHVIEEWERNNFPVAPLKRGD